MLVAEHGQLVLKSDAISKRFGTTQALSDVNLTLLAGEVHGLAGENGAGKSTLVRILGGAAAPDKGRLLVGGTEVKFRRPRDAIAQGVSVVHQELAVIPHLTVAENLLVGRLPHRAGVVSKRFMRAGAQELLDLVGAEIDVRLLVGTLSIGQQQLVEIARALGGNPRVLLLDEPSAILGSEELRVLFATVQRLAKNGVCILYISHRIGELFELTDRVTVLRDGHVVGSFTTAELDEDTLVRHMTGRQLKAPDRNSQHGDDDSAPALEVRDMRAGRRVRGVSLHVDRGEVVCLTGLVGSGRTELARAIVGADRIDGGEVFRDGRRISVPHPRAARDAGIGYLPEDRKNNGLLLNRSIRENVGVASLGRRSRLGVIRPDLDRTQVDDLIGQVDVRCTSHEQTVGQLSGGNQQKVLIARWLAAAPQVLILDEPTRGVDIGGKSEIYRVIADMAATGVAVLVISSEIEEVLLIADRVIVMREGLPAGEYTGEAITEDNIMHAALLDT